MVITAVCWLVSVVGIFTVAALGPSAAVPPLPGVAGWPPYLLGLHPPDGAVFALEGVAALTAVVAVWRMLSSLGDGHGVASAFLHKGGLLAAGVLTLLPPVGSADIKSYVAYGQLAAHGINPYLAGPQSLGVPQDPLTRAVEPPWQTTPSVYGPVFTRMSEVIADISGGDGHVAVTLTRLLITGGFVLTGVLLRALSTTEAQRGRAAVLWSANPFLLFSLVAGAHLDALVVAVVVGAIALARRAPLGAGVLLGLAATLKLTGLVALPAVLWVARPRLRGPALVAAGTIAFAVPWLAAAPGALTQLRNVSQFSTPAAPWRVVSSLIDLVLDHSAARSLSHILAAAAGLALIVLLLRSGLPPAGPTAHARAAAITAAFATGWVLTSAYVLPWYDALAWAPLALAGASFVDRVLLLHSAALTLAFLPGRDVSLSSGSDLVNRVLHSGVSPAILAVLIGVTARLATRANADVTSSGRHPVARIFGGGEGIDGSAPRTPAAKTSGQHSDGPVDARNVADRTSD